MSNTNPVIKFIVYGEPASKANSRKIVTIPIKGKSTGRTAVIKSQKARVYEANFRLQCPEIRPLLDGDVSVWITIYYASRRPDLDESVILDCMQAERIKLPNKKIVLVGGVYENDRQVKEKHIFWGLDRDNPRAEIRVEKR
jgi:hypothetical protein